MTDYNKGKIYRIVCNITGITYYGSTCEPTLARRLSKRVGNYECIMEGKKQRFMTSFEILEGGNYSIVLVEIFPCDSKMELHRRELFYIEGNDCVNKVIPTRTSAEYREDSRTHNIEKCAKYNKENAEKLKIQLAEYRKENADKIKIQRAKSYQKRKEVRLAKLNMSII